MDSWKKIKSRKVFESKWLSVDEEDLVTPSGKELTYYTVRKPAAAMIVPFDGQKFYLVKVFRPALFAYSWEFPAGVAPAATMEAVAKIELQEETGFQAGSWTKLSRFAGAPGTCDQMGEIFLAQDLVPGQTAREEGEIDMEVASFTESEIDEMIVGGKIVDGWTIASWCFYKLYLSDR